MRRHFVKYRNKSGNRNYGGIALYINDRIKDGVSYIPNQLQNVIWCKLNKEYFHTEKDIYLLRTVYLSPSKYERKQNADYIFELEEEISRFSTKGSL